MSTPDKTPELTPREECLQLIEQSSIADKRAFQEFLRTIFNNWTSKDPIPMPVLAKHTFAQSSVEVGRIVQDLPVQAGSVISDKRKKNAKAYLMVKRNDDDETTGFLWCDADGKPVKRSWIKKKRGIVISDVKEQLAEDYNNVECYLVDEYNCGLRLAYARQKVVKYAQRGSGHEAGADEGTDEGVDELGQKGYIFCDEDDPELN
ncbi:hypothetical protein FLONG3_5819 [Fusarium longipes]|uniref:Uncharacterized protein n=1 Tax=Fusarium longipes TaxID=694270 RepID=A0A395ST83_9HYPO|nr:hypothetical protein FLONG3_5819 [Fusarium longipes]